MNCCLMIYALRFIIIIFADPYHKRDQLQKKSYKSLIGDIIVPFHLFWNKKCSKHTIFCPIYPHSEKCPKNRVFWLVLSDLSEKKVRQKRFEKKSYAHKIEKQTSFSVKYGKEE